jgi:cytochrome d ubiquinol oxidase subunit I
VPLVYYAYHIMVGLGTILLLIAALAVLLLWRGRPVHSPLLWALMLSCPFTYIANIAGWTTAETGAQPWVVFGLLRTERRASPRELGARGDRALHAARLRGLYLLVGLLLDARSCGSSPGPRRRGPATRPQASRWREMAPRGSCFLA